MKPKHIVIDGECFASDMGAPLTLFDDGDYNNLDTERQLTHNARLKELT
jgi:hypothetical protein